MVLAETTTQSSQPESKAKFEHSIKTVDVNVVCPEGGRLSSKDGSGCFK